MHLDFLLQEIEPTFANSDARRNAWFTTLLGLTPEAREGNSDADNQAHFIFGDLGNPEFSEKLGSFSERSCKTAGGRRSIGGQSRTGYGPPMKTLSTSIRPGNQCLTRTSWTFCATLTPQSPWRRPIGAMRSMASIA